MPLGVCEFCECPVDHGLDTPGGISEGSGLEGAYRYPVEREWGLRGSGGEYLCCPWTVELGCWHPTGFLKLMAGGSQMHHNSGCPGKYHTHSHCAVPSSKSCLNETPHGLKHYSVYGLQHQAVMRGALEIMDRRSLLYL